MNRSFINIIFLILVLVSSQLILFSCAGPQEIPEGEKKYIEGVVVQGGVNAFRMRGDNGEIFRFEDRNDIEYQPSDFHAYYGDRVRMTYYTKIKGDKELHMALRIVLLSKNRDRINFQLGEVEGIIRASGVMRYLVYLPKKDLTVAVYRNGAVKRIPKNWSPEAGNKVRVFVSEDSGRFIKKFKCYQINRLGEDPVSIQDKSESGVITEIFVHRSIHRAPDRFAFQLNNGDTLTMWAGGETRLVPVGIKVKVGKSYSIEYYRLLLGDQSIRNVATRILTR
jgi:hypothetical protein